MLRLSVTGIVILLVGVSLAADPTTGSCEIDIPDDIPIGCATAAYQIEGGWNATGKGESIWDYFTHNYPERTSSSNGDVACDHFNKYEQDIKILKSLNVKVYRHSISWPRILPTGDVNNINVDGIAFYYKIFSLCKKAGIEVSVTMHHWDIPQKLQELGGWQNEEIVNYFVNFADLLFRVYGSLVKQWVTVNEPWTMCTLGYSTQELAPGNGITGVSEYLCGHNVLKAHSQVYRLYARKYRLTQKGKIGLVLNGGFYLPKTNSSEDIKAAEDANQFMIGWFANPVIRGDYPPVMRKNIDTLSEIEGRPRSRLPTFTTAEKINLIGTVDFFGVNHYTSYLCTRTLRNPESPGWFLDTNVTFTQDSSLTSSETSTWLAMYPPGIGAQLKFMKKNYGNLPLIITENGWADKGEADDQTRIQYIRDYLNEVIKAKKEGCNVQGYIVWSCFDNFEWANGYQSKFGVVGVNFTDPKTPRYVKKSTSFFQKLALTKKIPCLNDPDLTTDPEKFPEIN